MDEPRCSVAHLNAARARCAASGTAGIPGASMDAPLRGLDFNVTEFNRLAAILPHGACAAGAPPCCRPSRGCTPCYRVSNACITCCHAARPCHPPLHPFLPPLLTHIAPQGVMFASMLEVEWHKQCKANLQDYRASFEANESRPRGWSGARAPGLASMPHAPFLLFTAAT